MDHADSVLVVVDVQNGFVSNKSAHIVPEIVKFVEQWSATGRPYIMTRFLNHKDSSYERLIGWRRMQSPPETDIVDSLSGMISGAVAIIDKPI